MKVLQVNCVYKKGSTGKIVADIHSELQRHGIESVVCYGRGAKASEPNVYKTCSEWYSRLNNLLSRFTGLMYGGCFLSTLYLMHVIKKEHPDVVHLHCINGYFVNVYRLIAWLKRKKIKTVLTLHAEFMHTANCGYAMDCNKWMTGCGSCPRLKKETKSLFMDRTAVSWNKMKNAFENFHDLTVVSVSPWLMSRAEQSPILKGLKHTTVFNGVDSEVFKPRNKSLLREKYGLVGKKIVFHVTSAFSTQLGFNKGGYYVLQLARILPDIDFLVAGPCNDVFDLPGNIHTLGVVSNQNVLADYYSLSDATLIVSERETFSMPVAESVCCGTPVVGFKSGGPETICPESMKTNFFEYGDLESLVELLNHQNFAKAQFEDSILYLKENMTCQYVKTYMDL